MTANTSDPEKKASEQSAGGSASQRDGGTGNSDRGPQWRVEGPARGAQPGRPGLHGSRRLWPLVLVLLAVNFAVASSISVDHRRLTVPYSYFRQQALASNIAEVSSRGDTIEGKFRREVRFPAGEKGRVSHLFKTERPAFADDEILDVLLRKNVTVNAKPPDSRSLVSMLLFGFGPTILLVGLSCF